MIHAAIFHPKEFGEYVGKNPELALSQYEAEFPTEVFESLKAIAIGGDVLEGRVEGLAENLTQEERDFYGIE